MHTKQKCGDLNWRVELVVADEGVSSNKCGESPTLRRIKAKWSWLRQIWNVLDFGMVRCIAEKIT
jgi:hypothetical protein